MKEGTNNDAEEDGNVQTVIVEDIPPQFVRMFVRILYSDMWAVSNIPMTEWRVFLQCIRKLAPEHLNRIRQLLQQVTDIIDLPSILFATDGSSKEIVWAVDNPKYHDVVFVVGENEQMKRIVAHKVLLRARSPYFNAMLMGSLKVSVYYHA